MDRLAARAGIEFRKERFWNAERAKGKIHAVEVTLIKPLSYVNLTGPIVRKVREDLDIGIEDTLIVVDDFWLPLGKLRMRRQGGGGGHNGLASVVKCLSPEVPRLRIGIGAPGDGSAVNHVLSRFRKDELPIVQDVIDRAADAAEVWASEGPEAAMNRFNPSSME
jgi:PTH1 family peptidyl-tRNA hydrolase